MMGSDRGSAALEVVVVAPAVILVIMFLVLATRQPAAQGEVNSAAKAAARAASLESVPSDAVAAGIGAGDVGAVCTTMNVNVDVSRWDDGWVSAEVDCVINTSGISLGQNSLSVEAQWTEQVQQAGRTGE